MEALKEEISLAEAVALAAVDNRFYGHFFFPQTCRQQDPPFHTEIDEVLAGPDRYVAFMIFRGGAKTTKLRLYTSKLVAYALSRTILYVGKSEGHAVYSLAWIKRQVEYNLKWARAFGLKKGKKWSDTEIEVVNTVEGVSIWIIALGITGSTRGINLDDYRPDTIIVDDPSDEENTATPEQREKTDDFINGSLRNSLAPESEASHAKMIFLQTLLHSNDSIARCEKDPAWRFLKFSVFDENGESRWPARWSTAELLKEKESFIARGKLHLWMREMECTVLSDDLAAFKVSQLQYYDLLPEDQVTYVMAIDPVPPPSDRELERGLKGKDWEVIAVVGRWRDRYFLAEYATSQGHNPDWTIAKFFEFKEKYKPIKCGVETVNYQRTLKWLLEQAMARRGEWMQIDDFSRLGKTDRRKKSYRIIDNLGSVVANGKLYVRASHHEFIEQFTAYPAVQFDDVIEAVSMAVKLAAEVGGLYEGEYETLIDAERDIPELERAGGCP